MTLTSRTSPERFRACYFLKTELQRFCRAHGLSASGGKLELVDRIERFLRTGDRERPRPPAAASAEARAVNALPSHRLSVETVAPAGFRCTQEARRFFCENLGTRFRFTVPLQAFIREHPGITFRRIAEEWRRQEDLRRAGMLRTEIAPQFELNRFTRDYFADPRNAGRTRQDCLEAWRRARTRPGDHSYRGEER